MSTLVAMWGSLMTGLHAAPGLATGWRDEAAFHDLLVARLTGLNAAAAR